MYIEEDFGKYEIKQILCSFLEKMEAVKLKHVNQKAARGIDLLIDLRVLLV
ncbi:hypothetical protein CBE01nite_19320 [Clostridium beijerinckii]|uniref:hypothetical protein n=1 Tax=Clostridium beijerinckii TaxID=1520 RepID=UPI0009D56972|nr:hypothetical protein [Clostridium beijerinckii]NYB96847.1 hypothetical protein [Clostridium beijerinckii]OOM22816.1 hypothetical protein CLBEI_30330 [Clostridium beijerinckii]GEP64164.1 hypothetical protein CBE01nite_19320 [Clostridium beijerinckii]SQB11700.1 Uncharacterised protein [Clostridium beijerinckii]